MERNNTKKETERERSRSCCRNNCHQFIMIHCRSRATTYPLYFLQGRFGRLVHLFQCSPVRIAVVFTPLGVLALLEHSTEVHTAGIYHNQPRHKIKWLFVIWHCIGTNQGKWLTGYEEGGFSSILSMFVGDDESVVALVIRFRFANSQREGVGLAVRDVSVTAAIHNLRDTLSEFRLQMKMVNFFVCFGCPTETAFGWISTAPHSCSKQELSESFFVLQRMRLVEIWLDEYFLSVFKSTFLSQWIQITY